jgi:mono/diheme cytochrome c family protein
VTATRIVSALAIAGLLAGCGAAKRVTLPNTALIRAGALVVAQSGCEACHQIGDQGNEGPGPALTTVGARLSVAAITRALDEPKEPMPSFAALPSGQHKAVIAYLASLRSKRDVIAEPQGGSENSAGGLVSGPLADCRLVAIVKLIGPTGKTAPSGKALAAILRDALPRCRRERAAAAHR